MRRTTIEGHEQPSPRHFVPLAIKHFIRDYVYFLLQGRQRYCFFSYFSCVLRPCQMQTQSPWLETVLYIKALSGCR